MSRFFFFMILLFFPLFSWASLDEITLFTSDKTCAIHYLTTYPRQNRYIQVPAESCKNGWVDGMSKVRLFSLEKGNTEILEGFFSQGYWVDSLLPVGPVIERKSPSEGVQSLSFLLGEDEEANITYIGQLRAVQPKGRSYGPFLGCPDFRVLVVVSDPSLFSREAFLDKIVTQGLDYARSYCQKLDVVALFGATTVKQAKILFHMQVDPDTGTRRMIPVTTENDSLPDSLLELKSEQADVLLSVKPEKEKAVVSYQKTDPVLAKVPEVHPKNKDILAHLRILSRTLRKPLLGRIAVHIRDILLDGTGVTDLPEELKLLYYPGLKKGWAVVEGMLSDDNMQVSKVQFCQQEWCSDVP